MIWETRGRFSCLLVIKTVYTFDNDGNIVSEYVYSEDTGNTGVEGEESGIHPHSGDGGAGVVSNINNLILGHNFEDLIYWKSMDCNCEDIFGDKGTVLLSPFSLTFSDCCVIVN